MTASEERNRLVQAPDGVYRQDLVRISTIIHSKTSPALHEFAEAFRFKERGSDSEWPVLVCNLRKDGNKVPAAEPDGPPGHSS
jgi:hypothetical protein